jgi:hypothetical protein
MDRTIAMTLRAQAMSAVTLSMQCCDSSASFAMM